MNDIDALLASINSSKIPVTVGGMTVGIRPVTLIECLRTIKRFPAIKNALGLGSSSAADDTSLIDVLLSDGPEAVGALLACAVGHPGDVGREAALTALPDDVLLPLIQAVIETTMPDGLEVFFGRLAGLANASGLKSQAA